MVAACSGWRSSCDRYSSEVTRENLGDLEGYLHLLDGIDEMPTELLERLGAELREFIAREPQVHFICSVLLNIVVC